MIHTESIYKKKAGKVNQDRVSGRQLARQAKRNELRRCDGLAIKTI